MDHILSEDGPLTEAEDIKKRWQEYLRRNGVAIMVKKRVRNAILGCNLKNDRMISVHFQGKPFNITVIQSMPQPVTLEKLKLNGSMKTCKTF